jgi:hypothetical protein
MLMGFQILAQVQKQTKEDTHVWIAFISSIQLNEKWNLLADVHYRRTDFLNRPGFFVARVAPEYKFKSGLKLAAGYANLLSAPTNSTLNTCADEHRIFQQKQTGFQYDLNHTIRLFFYRNFSGEHHKNHQHSL